MFCADAASFFFILIIFTIISDSPMTVDTKQYTGMRKMPAEFKYVQ